MNIASELKAVAILCNLGTFGYYYIANGSDQFGVVFRMMTPLPRGERDLLLHAGKRALEVFDDVFRSFDAHS